MFSILRPYIFSLDPEVAHDLAIKSLKANILPKSFFKVPDEEMLEIFEATANDDDSKEMPDDVIDTLMKNVGSVLQKDKPKKTAIYEGYEIQF